MAQKPAGRGNPRTRANRARNARTTDQWLELPGWRKPLDALFVFALTAAVAWLVLVTIPAAADRSPDTALADESTTSEFDESVPDEPDQPTDDGDWIAGPVYTGAPPAPESAAIVPVENTGARPAVAGASSRGVARVTPSRTAARTSARPTPPSPVDTPTPLVSAPPETSAATVAGETTTSASTSAADPTTSTSSSASDTTTSTSASSETTTTTSASPTSTAATEP